MVTGVFANQAMKELKLVKKDLDGLKREVALLKQERDFLFPVSGGTKSCLSRNIMLILTLLYAYADRKRGERVLVMCNLL